MIKIAPTGTVEPRTDQIQFISTVMLAELQHLHGLNTHEEFNDIDDELEDLSVCNQDQNADYDCEMNTDAAALWLQAAAVYA
jgi:hypothetical protein